MNPFGHTFVNTFVSFVFSSTITAPAGTPWDDDAAWSDPVEWED